MNRVLMTVFALTLAASCSKDDAPGGQQGGAPKGGGGETPSQTLTCAQVAEKAVGGLGPGGGPVKDKLRPIYEKRCTDDKWPAASMECFAKAEGMPALKQCREALPEVSKQNLLDQIRMVMSAAGGGSGMRGMRGPHGGGSGSDAPPASGSGSDAKPADGSAASGSGSAKATPK